MFNQLSDANFDPIKFINANLNKNGMTVTTMLQHLTNAEEQEEVVQKDTIKSSQKFISEQYVKTSNIATNLQHKYLDFERDYKQLQVMNINVPNIEQNLEDEEQMQDFDQTQLSQLFQNLLAERKFIAATAFLHVIYTVSLTSKINFEGQNKLLKFFTESRITLREYLLNSFDFKIKEDIIENIFYEQNTGFKFLDQHFILINSLCDPKQYENQCFTNHEQLVLIAFNLNFVADLFDILQLDLPKIDFYIDPSSASQYLQKAFSQLIEIVNIIKNITQITIKYDIQQNFHQVKIQTILNNFNKIRVQIIDMLEKSTEQSRIDMKFKYNFQVLRSCQDELFKNQNFLRNTGYYIGIDDGEIQTSLNGIQTLLIDLQVYMQSSKYFRIEFKFQTNSILPKFLQSFECIFLGVHDYKIDQYQEFCLTHCKQLSEIIEKQPELSLEIIQKFLQNILVQKIIVHAVNEADRFVEFVFSVLLHFKFVIPECHNYLREKGSFGTNYLDQSEQNCSMLLTQMIEPQIIKQIKSLTVQNQEIENSIDQITENMDQQQFGQILKDFVKISLQK